MQYHLDFPDMVSLANIGDSEARITAKVLGCRKQEFNDEFDFFFLPCLRLKKYKYVQDWFEQKRQEALSLDLQNRSDYDKKVWYKSQSLDTIVAGIPHGKNLLLMVTNLDCRKYLLMIQ